MWPFKRKGKTLTMRDGGFGSPLEADIGRMLAAIDAMGKREMLAARMRALMNRRVELLEVAMTILGGEFKATWRFDGREL